MYLISILNDADSAIVVIPGNPGILGLYRTFAESLSDHLGKKYDVYALGHLNHNKTNNNMYSLQDQVNHKLLFLLQLKKYEKIHLIGHSVGGYICLEILRLIGDKVPISRVFLVCPTLSHIKKSANGVFFVHSLWILNFLWSLLAYIIEFIPKFLIGLILTMFCKLNPEEIYPSLYRNCILNSKQMANDEMKEIQEPDLETITKYKNKIFVFYAQKDGWVYRVIPELKHAFFQKQIPHAFVLNYSKEVSKLIASYIMA